MYKVKVIFTMAVRCQQDLLFLSQTYHSFEFRHSMFRVRPTHFSSPSFSLFKWAFPTFPCQSFSFFESDLAIFSSQSFPFFRVNRLHFSKSVLPIFSGQSFPIFQVSPSHFWNRPSHFFKPFHFSKSVLLTFRVRPSNFFGSVPPTFPIQSFS